MDGNERRKCPFAENAETMQGAGGCDIEQVAIGVVVVSVCVGVGKDHSIELEAFRERHGDDQRALKIFVLQTQLVHVGAGFELAVERLGGGFGFGDQADAAIIFRATAVDLLHETGKPSAVITESLTAHSVAVTVEGFDLRRLVKKVQGECENLAGAAEAFRERVAQAVFFVENGGDMVVERSVSALRQTLVDIAEDGEFGIWKKLVKNLELQRRVILPSSMITWRMRRQARLP